MTRRRIVALPWGAIDASQSKISSLERCNHVHLHPSLIANTRAGLQSIEMGELLVIHDRVRQVHLGLGIG
jgi:hypothetical protein